MLRRNCSGALIPIIAIVLLVVAMIGLVKPNMDGTSLMSRAIALALSRQTLSQPALANHDDSDGLLATDPRTLDSDGDGLPDVWEIRYGMDPLDQNGEQGADGDLDGDGLSNLDEWANRTDPNNPDTDDDGLPDHWEVENGLDPTSGDGVNGATDDLDDDGLSNLDEWTLQTYPDNPDSDGDTLADGWEVVFGLNPRDNMGADGADGDPDSDGIPNAVESAHYLSPREPDDSIPDLDHAHDDDNDSEQERHRTFLPLVVE
jgi:hypothetical protein